MVEEIADRIAKAIVEALTSHSIKKESKEKPEQKSEEIIEKAERKQEYVCEICGFRTTSKKGYAGHMRLAHQKPTLREGVSIYAEESIKKAQEMIIKIVDERIQKHLEAFANEIKSVLNVLKENDEDIINGIKKRDEELVKLWKHEEDMHSLIKEIADKLGYEIKYPTEIERFSHEKLHPYLVKKEVVNKD
jgi:rubrerythrin